MATFDSLPRELKANVLAFVRSAKDRANACLVSREWKQLMAPMLWETLDTDLEETSSRRLITLLDPDNGILRHIRHLYIRKGGDCLNTNLVILLGYLPKDRLRTLVAFNTQPPTLAFLLRTQRQLVQLDTPLQLESVTSAAAANTESTSWMKSSLTKLEDLTVYLRPGDAIEASYEPFRHLLSSATSVKGLTITGDFNTRNNFIIKAGDVLPLRGDSSTQPLSLKRLVLNQLWLGYSFVAVLQEIDFLHLVRLDLRECSNMVPFLTALTASFSRTSPALECLELCYLESVDDDLASIQATEDFLRSFKGLKELFLSVDRQDVVSKGAITHHAETLEVLGLGHVALEHREKQNSDIIDITKICIKLQELAISLGPCNLVQFLGFGHGFRLSDSDEDVTGADLEAVLQAVAKLPKLRVLRMSNLATIANELRLNPDNITSVNVMDRDVYACQERMQNFANRIMSYLVHRGSNIKLFNTEPYWSRMACPKKDANGHQWPSYSYWRGKYQDCLGNECVVATPLIAELEIPDTRVLGYSER